MIQEHAARRLHYDLRLELDGVLKSWAVPKAPSPDPDIKRLAVMVEDHPLDYASFEGTIPEGEYGAGEVRIWDKGTYSAEEHGSVVYEGRKRSEEVMREGLAEGKISFVLHGRRLAGSWTLVKTRRIKDKDNWLLIKHREDAAASAGVRAAGAGPAMAGVAAAVAQPLRTGTGARTVRKKATGEGRRTTLDLTADPEAKPAPFPSFISPMLATAIGPPDSGHRDDRWLWEPKLDGYRIIAAVRDGKARLLSRNAIDVTERYPDIAQQLAGKAGMAATMVLDGEIVAVDQKGRPCFQCLQHLDESQKPGSSPASAVLYYVFDILYFGGRDLQGVPLQRRKEVLGAVLASSDAVRLVEYFTGDPRPIFQSAVDTGFEGIVGKLRDSTYEAGVRSRSWVKIKALQSDDFVVGGFTRGARSRSHTFGALLLGQYDKDGRLTYAGNVGSGFDEDTLTRLRRRLDAMATTEGPFAAGPRLTTDVTWVRPEMVVEVKFDQRTREGYLRIPIFLRVRDDKPPTDARAPEDPGPARNPGPAAPVRGDRALEHVLDQLGQNRDAFALDVDGEKVPLTNMSKALWPSAERPITKRDLLIYLARVSPHLLRHTRDRPLSLTRYPDGVDGPHFYQKHWPDRLPRFVETVRLHTRSEGWQQYLLCQNLPTLLWLGQMANLEFHVWFSRVVPEPDGEGIPRFSGPVGEAGDHYSGYPDFVIFDLDPYIYSGDEPKGAEPELNRQAYARTCQVARWLKELLDGLSLASFVKTSGRTGLHVYVPIRRHFGFDTVRQTAAIVAGRLLRDHPQDITLEWSVEKRTGKVFVDFNQNVQGKTLACAYSPRPSPEGAISLPLPWENIEKAYPTDFTVLTAASRIDRTGDPWQDMMQSKKDLKQLVRSGAGQIH